MAEQSSFVLSNMLADPVKQALRVFYSFYVNNYVLAVLL